MKSRLLLTYITALLIIGTNAPSMAQSSSEDTIVQSKTQLRDIAYGTQPQWKISSALSSVEGTRLQKYVTTNLANTLQGHISGLTVIQNNGEPGMDSPMILGRGIGTYGPGRDILVMVDGFESSFEQFTPFEIESITFLKDAAATAIYGSRGANGVLLVTTKRGQEGPLLVDFSAFVGFQKAKQLPQFLGSYDYARLYNEALENDGRPLAYSPDELDAYRTGRDPYLFPDVDYYDELLRGSAPVSNYNLSFRGGDKTVRYFGLLNFLDNNSLLINSADISPDNSINAGYRRYNFRTNVDVDLTNTLTASLTLGGSVEDKSNPTSYNTEPTFNLMSSIAPNAFPLYNPDGSYGGNSLYTNPLGDMLERGQYTSNSRTLQSTFRLAKNLDEITEGLSTSVGISFNNFFRNYSARSRQYARYSITGYDNTNNEYLYNQIGQNTQLEGDEGQSDQWRNFAFQGTVGYTRKFGNNDLDALLIYSSENSSIQGLQHPYKYVGVGGRLTYTVNDKYVGEFSFGYNGTEKFPKGNRFGFFPAASLGWVASNEEFLKGSDIISFLKFRASYGLTGNHHIADEQFLFDQAYVYTSSYYFGTTNSSNSSIYEGRPANPDITWEKDKKFNIGFEALLLNRLELALDIFRNSRYDILANPNQQVPGIFGMDLNQIWLNQGKVDNRGFEASSRYVSNPTRSLQYHIGASVWYAKNKIAYMSENIQLNEYQYRTGQAVDQPFGLVAIGFFEDEADISNSPVQTFAPVQPGDIKYKDQNGDGIINNDDIGPVGNPNYPELSAGVNLGLSYKGFDLDMMFHGVTGHSIYLSGYDFHAFQNNGKISEMALGRWTPETHASATYPRLSSDDNLNNYRYSSFWQKDGSFIKLRHIEIGYTLQNKLFNRVGLKHARVFINGSNLFTWDRVEYVDPEILTGYPAVRTLSAGFSIQL